jgi:anti-sigma regulatory factor (Ser/Thr protein kinase)
MTIPDTPRVALRPLAPSPLPLLSQVPAHAAEVAGLRTAVVTFAETCGINESARADVALAVGEACTNVVMHAYVGADAPGSLIVEASQLDGALVVAVRDEGRGMLPRADSPGLGLGLSIIARLSHRLEIGMNGTSGTEVRMTFVVSTYGPEA